MTMNKKYDCAGVLKMYFIFFFILSTTTVSSQFLFSDQATNYSGSWTDAANQGTGFLEWDIESNGASAGNFIGNPSADGMGTNDIGTTAFALYAHSGNYVNAVRYFGNSGMNVGMMVGDVFRFYWSMNWDAGGGNKGFDFRSGNTILFNVNNSGSASITTTNGLADANYGTTPMLVTLTRTSSSTYTFSMTSRSGGATYSTLITTSSEIDNIKFYAASQSDNSGNRNIYFNAFSFTKDSNYLVNGTIVEPRVLDGSNGIHKQGSGLLTLVAQNTFTGTTTVASGTLQLSRIGGETLLESSDIVVNSGAILRISSNQTLHNLTIDAGGTVLVDSGVVLKVNGLFVNNGQIVFKSDATGSGLFDVFTGTISGSGSAVVERYIPARRAFRFLSPSVTTTTSIFENWQENGSSTAGLGTHITGINGAANGFDTTAANNPSLYTFNTTTGQWTAVTNTNTNTLSAGTAYRLMVRGDRTVDLGTNSPPSTPTTLRTTGDLFTGSFTPDLNQTSEGYSFVGNPYQAPVDIKAVLAASSNMNADVVYYWDPTLNLRGGYVTRTLSANTNNVASDFTEILQPGQAVFVKKQNTVATASMTFNESDKVVSQAAAGVFKTSTTTTLGMLRIHLQANINNQWKNIEGTLAVFDANYSWNATPEDAFKLSNLDEEVSFLQDNTSLAIALQPNPSTTNELPIRLMNTQHSNYQWQFEVTNYNGLMPYLFDALDNTYTPISHNTIIPFTVNGLESSRFKIVFQTSVLGTPDFNHQIALYPNPAKKGTGFHISGVTGNATVQLYTLLGQSIPVHTSINGNTMMVQPASEVIRGIYLVQVTNEGTTSEAKWIVEN